MRVLCDFHHADLYESLCILFQDRMGWEVYRPFGLAWFTEGYWKIHRNEDTAKQFLTTEGTLDANGKPLPNESMPNTGAIEEAPGLWSIPDSTGRPRIHNGIELQAFLDMDFDIVVSSIPPHIEPFNRLAATKDLKHIFQAGNNFSYTDMSFRPAVANVMSSAIGLTTNPGTHAVYYHQEFDLERFCPGPCTSPRSVANFQHYMPMRPLWDRLSKLAGGSLEFHEYGDGSENGRVLHQTLPDTIREHGYVYHVKPQGDGFGYNIHYAAACGRPLITIKRHFRGMTADKLIDDTTCVLLDHGMKGDEIISFAFAPDGWAQKSKAFNQRFRELVNYDWEFEHKLLPFLSDLK